MADLETRVQFIKGVGEARAKTFAKQNIFSINDLLRNYPRAYEDWNSVVSIRDAEINER